MRNQTLLAFCLLFAASALFADSGSDGPTERLSNPALPEVRDTIEAERAVRTILHYGGRVSRDDSSSHRPVVFATLRHVQFTDAGLRGIGALKELGVLNLEFSQVTDGGLTDLRGLDNLISLDLSYTQVTDKGMKQLRQNTLCKLRGLRLQCTAVTDAGVKEIVALKNLRGIDLARTKVTDAGLKELAALPELHGLDLYGTTITDTGLKALSAIKSLRFVCVGGTGVTQAGIASFKKALPGCEVDNR